MRGFYTSRVSRPRKPALTIPSLTHMVSKASAPVSGISSSGKRFTVPDTGSFFHSMTTLSLASTFTYAILGALIAYSLSLPHDSLVHLWLFLACRLGYNVGLGLILYSQSKAKLWTRCFTKLHSLFPSLINPFLRQHVRDKAYSPSEYPKDFNSWVAFRMLVDVCLCCDPMSYLLLVFHSIELPTSVTFFTLLQYSIGILLILFNIWAKLDAHRVIGNYAWYWGDFFFLIETDLKFDGIFKLFPHPMYTVGYSVYYGMSLLSGSYLVFLASLLAHSLQILFLAFVETPHIEQLYGSDSAPPRPTSSDPTLESLYLRNEPVLFFNLDWTRASDSIIMIAVVYVFYVSFSLQNRLVSLLHVCFWKLLYWFYMTTILSRQSSSDWWVRIFKARGLTRRDAFYNWKRMYNFLTVVNLMSFIGSAISQWNAPTVFTLSEAAYIAAGLVLILINLWAFVSVYQAIGDFGWFYGDFFLSQSKAVFYTSQICYSGVYRFTNNPDCWIGYLGLHGVALITRNLPLFGVSIASQCFHAIFIKLVEEPHMEKLYTQIRHDEPLFEAIRPPKSGPSTPEKQN